jgi:hypothetical protein
MRRRTLIRFFCVPFQRVEDRIVLIFIDSFRINIQEHLLLLKKEPFQKRLIEGGENVQNTILGFIPSSVSKLK